MPDFGGGKLFSQVVAKTANYAVLAGDNGTLFTNRGAAGSVTFTLPAVAAGLFYGFYCEADQELVVSDGAIDTCVVFNDAAADSVTIHTGTNSKRLGGCVFAIPNDNASKWLIMSMPWIVADTANQSQFTIAT